MSRKKQTNKKRKLIPLEKTRHVIYLDERGKEPKKHIAAGVLLAVAGLLCIAYCIAIFLSGAAGTGFFLIWGAMGAACILLALILNSRKIMAALPGWFKKTFVALVCAGLVLFIAVEGIILSKYSADAAPGADYCLILGAQWKSTGPSDVLRRRLDRAVAYLNESPDTVAIVSGGQGGNELIPEAVGMKEYLMNAGIAEERILTEPLSKNTYENLVFSSKLMDSANSRVVIVTNNFHVFRALQIAKKQGYGNVDGLAASSATNFLPNNLLREFVGVLKDFLVGNM